MLPLLQLLQLRKQFSGKAGGPIWEGWRELHLIKCARGSESAEGNGTGADACGFRLSRLLVCICQVASSRPPPTLEGHLYHPHATCGTAPR